MCKTRFVLAMAVLLLGASAGQAPAADDPYLVGWWTFDDGSGTVAKDSSGKGKDATLVGGPAWVKGKVGSGALSFDAVDDIVEVPEVPAFDMSDALTITAWIKVNNLSTYYFILDKSPSGTAPDNYPGNYEFRTNPSGNLQFGHQWSQGTDYTFYDSTTQVTAGRWTHVAVTVVKAGAIKFYIDGAPAGQAAQSTNWPVLNDEPLRIGGRKDGYSFFSGSIDDVRLYNRALTAGQVKTVSDGGAPVYGKAESPSPADGALAVTMPLLQWSAGDKALFHNVYLGTAPDLTEANLVGARQMFTMLYYVQGIQPGTTYYWRVDEIDAAGLVTAGDVWSFLAQASTAYYPDPADGTMDATQTPELTWLPGQTAIKHHVYFGDSSDAVSQGAADTDRGELTDPNFAPGALEALTTYYWRVDETVAGGAVKTGAVWKFATCLSIDDFEGYTDDEGSRIYETWIDGWTNGTGSTAGNATAPFAEQTIVHAGRQSMPLDYNNVKSPFYSEVEREFSPVQDWTAHGADTLVLYVRGQDDNTPDQVYVALEDASKKVGVVAYPDAAITSDAQWTEWRIPLGSFTGVKGSQTQNSAFGVPNLAKVKLLYIGVGDRKTPVKGGAGRIYIDDIRVTKP
jgi:hypothetical protein